MRTKALVAAAALLAAGALSSMAQSNVYSLNVVGYVNVTLNTGFNMLANQLDLDGTGLNNTVTTVFGTALPSGSSVYAYVNGAYNPSASYTTKGGWSGGAGVQAGLQPGGGVFVKVPSTATVTLVGNVLQGALAQTYNSGFNIIGSKVPQSGLLQTDLGYTPTSGDSVYRYDSATQAYLPSASYTTKGGWSPQPTIGVGEAFWLKSAAVSGGTWTRNFTVQ